MLACGLSGYYNESDQLDGLFMKGGGQQGQSGSGSMDILWITAFFVLIFAYLWYVHYDAIVKVIYYVKISELWLVYKCMELVSSSGLMNMSEEMGKMDQIYNDVVSITSAKYSLKELGRISNSVNNYYKYPFAAIGSIYILFILVVSKSSGFKSVFNMSKLREQEKSVWPYISSVPNNLIKKDLDDGDWAMSKQPLQIVLDNDLVTQEPVYGMVKLTVLDKKAYSYFSSQLGGYWTGRMDCLPNYAKALFAIFAAKGNGDDSGARNLIDQIAKSSGSGSLDFTGSLMLLKKHISSKGVGRAVSPHAYLLTAMASMLEFARTGGVLAMAEIIWLKKTDRKMWYMLQSVGRQTPFIEAAAPFAHWIVEKRLRRPLKVPMVKEAVAGLVAAVKDIKYNPDGY